MYAAVLLVVVSLALVLLFLRHMVPSETRAGSIPHVCGAA